MSIPCVYLKQTDESLFDFRKLQLNFEQTEKQHKNLLQQCAIFHNRAVQLCGGPESARDAELYKNAFQESITEFNSFGSAAVSVRYRLDAAAAKSLYSFKVPRA